MDVALSILLIFSAACYMLLGARLIASKREIGSMPIGVLFVVVSIWVMGGAIELMSSTYDVFSIGRTGHFIGTAFVPMTNTCVSMRTPKTIIEPRPAITGSPIMAIKFIFP